MNTKTKQLTEGAAVIAILGVFLLIDRQFAGILSSYILFLLPLPMLFYSAKYGFKSSLPVLFGMLFIAFIFSTIYTFIYVAGMCIIGLTYGSNVFSKKSSKVTLITTIVLAALVEIVCTLIMIRFFGYDINVEISSVKDMMNQFAASTNNVNLTNNINLFESLGMFNTIFYVTIVLTGVLEALLIHVIGRIVLRRFKIEVPKGDTLITHYPPKLAGYFAFLCFIAYFYSIQRPFTNELLEMGIQFIGTACMIYLLGYGIVAVYVFIASKRIRVNAFIMVILTMLLISILFLFTVILGFLYITTNLHSNMLNKE